MDASARLARGHRMGTRIATLLQKRTQIANDKFVQRMTKAFDGAGMPATMPFAFDPQSWWRYAIDATQRSILYWNTLWERGNNFNEHTAQGLKPVLSFESDIVLDGRTFERPVNYALLSIRPPEGVRVDPGHRPYIVIDPRAGHGPGIGGFKDDSQVGVAMRAGHPVYFVIFFRDPERGQTLLDVCRAEQLFVKKVRELHPKSAKPAIVGNCQGGWAAMMLAASDPEDTGPIVINGAPMSYWGGAWSEGEGDNPMRYAGGMLGGSWLASFAADLGNGKFDGAHLVQNFENLNPANSLWDKYYHLFDKADTEPPRFLEFEHWWGGYYLMNREEIEWITRNLFVGNKLWTGNVKAPGGKTFDLREIRSPIILFASMGDNITPPQQAFNWVVDVYGSTEEIKTRGQVIVGLLHESIGHLGIFVSGKVAKKEHTQIVSVLKTIERLPPGLYGMKITEVAGNGSEGGYSVEFHEHRLEDIAAQLNRFQRADEKAFEAVTKVSDLNQRAYELFAQPFTRAMANEYTAEMLREFHPLRFQNWAISSLNPFLAWLAPAAQAVKSNRQTLQSDHPLRRAENIGSEVISASLDYYRAMRDAMTEAGFFSLYGNLAADDTSPELGVQRGALQGKVDPRELPIVRGALASIEQGGYLEALARAGFLIARKGEPLPLSRLELRQELASEYADYLPETTPHEWRRIRGEQEIIARFEPERAVQTLPLLLGDRAERRRFLELLDKLTVDERVQDAEPTGEQLEMLGRIRKALAQKPAKAASARERAH
jgi:pimeloyl-ACP methyl ester carboxylesterase